MLTEIDHTCRHCGKFMPARIWREFTFVPPCPSCQRFEWEPTDMANAPAVRPEQAHVVTLPAHVLGMLDSLVTLGYASSRASAIERMVGLAASAAIVAARYHPLKDYAP
jgi:hypothetical protein